MYNKGFVLNVTREEMNRIDNGTYICMWIEEGYMWTDCISGAVSNKCEP